MMRQMPKAVCVHESAGEVRVIVFASSTQIKDSILKIRSVRDAVRKSGHLKCIMNREALPDLRTICEGSNIQMVEIGSSPADTAQLRRNCEIPRKPGRFFRVGGRWDFRFF